MTEFSFQELKKIVSRSVQVEEKNISEDSRLLDDLGIDSINLIKIIDNLSQDHNVSFEDIDFEGVETLGQTYDALRKSLE